MTLFELIGTIAIKNSEANKALDETSTKGQQTQSKLSKAFSAVGKGAAVVGKAVGTGLVVAGGAMAGLTVKALNLSGELEQNMGGSEQVFGKYAGKMQETAKNAFSNMGLSTADFLGTANKMGALFQGAGFSIQESSDLSASAMQRAADVASIMGIDTSAAMEAIAGAAKGNFTMMDNLGVAMNDTALNAYALEKGIDKTTQEMSQQEKIALAMEMFMEKTAYAAGNYAKENETLAGALGTAKAALTNFLDGSGNVDQLVGAFKNAATVIVDNVKTIAPRLIGGITELINQILPMVPPLLQKLLPSLIEGAIALLVSLAQILPEIAIILVEQVPVIIGLIKDALVEQFPQLAEPFEMIGEFFKTAYSGAVDLINSVVAGFQEAVAWASQHETALAMIAVAVGTLTTAVAAYNVAQAIKNAGGIVELAQLGATAVGYYALVAAETAHTVATTIATTATAAFGAVLSFLTSPITLVVVAIGALIAVGVALYKNWDTIKAKCSELGAKIKTKFTEIKNTVVNKTNEMKAKAVNKFNELKTNATNKANELKTNVTNRFNEMKTNAVKKITELRSNAVNKFNEIKSGITEKINGARDAVKSAIDKIKGFFNFTFRWPHIPLPHFAISPAGWKVGDLLKGVKPDLSIEWYAKAMNNPMIMDDPTIFGYNPATGKMMGGGEAGSEVVSGTNTLMNMISAAVRAEAGATVERLERIISLLVQFFPDALEAMQTPMVLDPNGAAIAMAPAMNAELGRIAIKKGRGR